ncbi:hypothetical protein ZWY2020_045386 [Hordeum vulgare]|nr:hypothetical protein ZWY2020_045386 [Hordeum vulgare]
MPDIWHHIHSLLPLRDAARTACVSRTFLRSWSYHPHLIFNKHILGLNSKGCATDLIRTIDHVLKKHSGVNVKTLTLELYDFPEVANALCCQLDSWLEIAMRPGIEEINLLMRMTSAYKFPCRLLSDRIRKSIRCLKLFFCDFRPTVKLGPFKSLAMLCLCHVGLNEYDLVCLLSNTLALEQLELITIDKLEFLEIPYQLQRLSCLTVSFCWKLYVLEIKAPNLRIIKLDVPNVERLSLGCTYTVPPPDMLPSKFLRLKGLVFSLPGRAVSPSYDYFSLVSLLDSCPSLETLYLNVSHDCAGHGANSEDPSHPRQAPGQHHVGNLKSVTISGFCSATSLVELTCYFLEMAASLEHLTLNVHGEFYVLASGACMPMYKGMLTEAPRTLLAIRKYVQAKVPSTVKLNVSEPCGQ